MTPAEYDLGLYIHIPFCPQHCDFCPFDTHPKNDPLMNGYLKALGQELDGYGNAFRFRSPIVSTLYFGGGTPSLLPPGDLLELLRRVRQNFKLAPDCEISLEAHPGTLTSEKLHGYFESGVNRLSLGVQSESHRDLTLLKRPYAKETIETLIHRARRIGYQNLSCDLMFGLPGQSLEAWDKTLEEILAMSPDHLSLYSLTVEPGTALEASVLCGRLRIPDEEIQVRMYDLACSKVSEYGLVSYEISNFGKPGKECRHNRRYWERTDYLGLGCSAHSAIGADRFSNLNTPQAYIQAVGSRRHARTETETLSRESRLVEALIFGLRQTSGISLGELRRRFSASLPDTLLETVDCLNQEGFLSFTGNKVLERPSRIRLTQKGIHLADEISRTLIALGAHG